MTMNARRILFLKAHVSAYTKKDGTFVAAHEDKRLAAKPRATSPKPLLLGWPIPDLSGHAVKNNVYHVAPSRALRSIKENGLEPRLISTKKFESKFNGTHRYYDDPRLYAFSRIDQVHDFMSANNDIGMGVLLRFRPTIYERWHEGEEDDLYTTDAVPPERISMLTADGWVPLKRDNQSGGK